jgi:PKD repeat protein
VVARSITTHYGTWTALWDSTQAGTAWGTAAWVATAPEGTSLRVRARSSESQQVWSTWEEATNGEALASTPAGRYLQVQVAMQDRSDGGTPVLEELTVKPAIPVQPPAASFSFSPDAPVAGEEVLFSDTSSGDPTSWSWDFGDGATSTDRNPAHVFAVAGAYSVTLAVANDQGSSETTREVVVAPSSTCSLVCSATAPDTARVGDLVRFAASATAEGCTGTVAYAWSFGDGATSPARQPSHTYAAAGTYIWSMDAEVDGVGCRSLGTIVVTEDGPTDCTVTRWVPVVSHASGVGASQWRSDVGLLAVGTDPTTAELRLHAPDGVVSRSVELDAGGLVELVDVVDWLAPGVDTSAALEVCADAEVVVTSRVYATLGEDDPCLPGGTFGQFMDGFDPAAGLDTTDSAVLSQLAESARFRTNIGLVNTGAETVGVRVELFDAGGGLLGEYAAELAPGQWSQASRPFAVHGGRDDLEAGWARVSVSSGSGVLAYGSVVDNVSNDATTVPMRR